MILPDELVMNKIYLIRGLKVMIDFDLASLYGVETRVLNQAVKRNSARFPGDFMFQLSKKEWEFLRSQIIISSGEINSSQNVMSSKKHRGVLYSPYVFTEEGVSMLSGVLKSYTAIRVHIQNHPCICKNEEVTAYTQGHFASIRKNRKKTHRSRRRHSAHISIPQTIIKSTTTSPKKNWFQKKR